MATVSCCIRGHCRVLNTVNRSYVTRNDIKGKKRPTGMCIKRGWVSGWLQYGSGTEDRLCVWDWDWDCLAV